MTKIFIIILAIYVLYYAGNIVYDLILKKGNTAIENDSQEFSLSAFAETTKDDVKDIGIEDVENLITPNSFKNKNFLFQTSNENTEEQPDIDFWREKFEAEENIDHFNLEKENIPNLEEIPIEERIEEIPKTSLFESNFKKILDLAETSVQVILNKDGCKIYQSIM